ncbi:putative metalloprotease with PDZ domain [Aquimarina sp. EL_43]|uniref:M61 family metallopeptidase n=1 Tax=unclassified Aquimarina TaxID=2627091 RepID=UPI0018C9C8E7|nr:MULTISPECIES: peptidase M61 [unclassified Aquimarina]MBG6129845.1 putative metalloprotease with PDZ domain [Aquimarina sp. EL_35]MBG6150910.1 putative metalloprotease with PDZ domain [Aquimarina sp. EL_32]MBG6167783.1 putative metalloprotease with PDZ domain [Aquimarina sp. EL_43]
MKKTLAKISIGVLLIGCGTSNPTNDIATNVPIATAIDLTQVKDDKVPVTIDPGRFIQDTVKYRIPKVVQGTYAVSDFGKFVDDFKAFDYQGNEIKTEKEDTNTWLIVNAKQLDKISYLVNDTYDIENTDVGTPFSPSGTNIEPENYVLNLHGFIGYFDVLKNNQYALEVKAPSEMKRTSALPNAGSTVSEDKAVTTDKYLATRYFEITDNPMMYGNLDVEEFMVGDIKIVLSIYSPNKVHTAAKIKETVFKMMKGQKAYLGDINSTPRYDIYLYLAPSTENAPTGFGALEHHTSTVVVLPEQMPDEALASAMIDVVSHEFFHIVTPLSVHSEDVHYFDYDKPTFSKHLWMYEGVTEYFATLFQVNQGLVEEQEFYDKIMGKIQSASGFDDTMSFTVMSENILDQPYASNYVNVYEKGALIGMCIDILMREESNGNRGILSLMKELSLKYGKNKPFNDDNIIEEITAMTYPAIGEFLKTHVVGKTPINYEEFFKKVGLSVESERVETNYIQNSGVLIVAGNQEKGTIFFTDLVSENSFWAENGAKANDDIVEVNGTKLTLQNANNILGSTFQWQEGDDIEVKLNRAGEEVIIKTKVTKSFTKGKKLKVIDNSTKEQTELRKAWLKG